jgi:hypothetical protein
MDVHYGCIYVLGIGKNLSIAQNLGRREAVMVAALDTGAQLDHLALADNFEDV